MVVTAAAILVFIRRHLVKDPAKLQVDMRPNEDGLLSRLHSDLASRDLTPLTHLNSASRASVGTFLEPFRQTRTPKLPFPAIKFTLPSRARGDITPIARARRHGTWQLNEASPDSPLCRF
jgi:hypothetical protein